MILYRSCIDLICLFCLCVTVKIQFDNTIVILSIHHTHPLLGHYARPRVCSPLFRNSGSAPDIIIYFRSLKHILCIIQYLESNSRIILCFNSKLLT